MCTFVKSCVKFSSFKSSKMFSSVHVFWVWHWGTSFSLPWAWTITFLKSFENWTNSEGKQSSKSLEYSSIILAAAHRMAKLLSSDRFVRKPNFSWMSLYGPNRCCRAQESLSMITRNTSTLKLLSRGEYCFGDVPLSNWPWAPARGGKGGRLPPPGFMDFLKNWQK